MGRSVGKNRNAYGVLMGKPEGKRPVVRTKGWWKYNKMDLKEIRLQGVKWLDLAQERDRDRTL